MSAGETVLFSGAIFRKAHSTKASLFIRFYQRVATCIHLENIGVATVDLYE